MSQGQLENFWAKQVNVLVKSKYKLFTYSDIFEELKNWVDERSYIENSDINLLKVSNVKNNEIVWDIAKISVFPSKWKLEKWDLLITRKWTVWESSIFNKDWDYFASSEVFIIKLKNEIENIKINKNYISLFNNFWFIRNQFKDKCVWAIMPSISQPDLWSIKIPLPPLEIQNQIVEKMDFALNEKKRKELEAKTLLESIDDFVLSELWIEYKEVEEKKVFGLSLSELWETKRIDSFYNNPKFLELEKMLRNGKYWVEKIMNLVEYYKKWIEVWSSEYIENWEIPFVRVSDIDNFWLDFKNCDKYILKEKFEELKQYKPEKWEVLFSKDWTIWFTCLAVDEIDYIISWWILRLKTNNKALPEYLQIILSRKIINRLLEQRSIWAIIKHLDLEAFESLNLPLPTLEIQEKIALEVKSRIEKAKVLEKEAFEVYESAKREVEGIILGEV